MSVFSIASGQALKAGGSYLSKRGHSITGELIEGAGDIGKDIYEALKDDIENHPLETTLAIVVGASIPIVFPALITGLAAGIVGASGTLAGPAVITAVETVIIDRLGVLFGSAAIGAIEATAQKLANVIAKYAVQYGAEKLTSGLFSVANRISAKFAGQNDADRIRFAQNPNGSVSLVVPNQAVVTNFLNPNNGIFYHNTFIDNGASVDVGNYDKNIKHVNTYRFVGGNSTLRIDGLRNFSGTISNFDVGDTINLAKIDNLPSVKLVENNHLLVKLQNGSSKVLTLSKEESYAGKLFETNLSPTGGANIVLADVSATATNPVISEHAGSEQFTLTRDGDISGSATVYVSTTDGSTVAGESANAGNINSFVYQPVTFAAGSSTAQVGVGVNDLGLYDGATNIYGIQITGDQSQNNILATSQFSIKDGDPNPITITPANPVIDEMSGSEQLTLSRTGNLSQAETVYIYSSVTSGPSGLLDGAQRLLAAPVTFAAGSATASIADPLGLFTESGDLTQNVGLKVTSDQQGQNVLGTGSFAVTQNEETFKYVGNNFTSNGLPSQTPFSPSSLDMSVTFQDLPENYTGQIGSIGGPEGGYEPIAWSAQSEGETQNQSSGITGDNFVFEFVNGQISNWGIKVSGYELNFSSGGFDAYSGSTNSPGDYAINETNYTRGATPTLGVWTRTA